MKKLTVASLILLFLAPGLAMAKSSYVKKFQAAYPQSKLTGCVICHASNGNYALNPYAVDLQKAAFDFKAIEQLDSDADGALNLVEIDAGTMPGDAKANPQREIMMHKLQNLSTEQLEVLLEWVNAI